MDKHLAKDDLSDSLEKLKILKTLKEPRDSPIMSMWQHLMQNIGKAEKKQMTLPSEILAFKLIRKANITKEEKLLVLTGMNYDNKGT